jgi:2-methylisocitrate lyase-like PEP mutase family enzyme
MLSQQHCGATHGNVMTLDQVNGLSARLDDVERERDIVVAPGVCDALTAGIAAAAGFDTLYLTGAGIAYCRLGRPDIGLVSSMEVAETIALIRDRVPCALIVDADTGYGNALNVQRTVRLFERAGASAIQLEDQVFPKRCGHLADKTVIPTAEMVGKIKAAVDARQSPETLAPASMPMRAPIFCSSRRHARAMSCRASRASLPVRRHCSPTWWRAAIRRC